jgi:hypothetical protein
MTDDISAITDERPSNGPGRLVGAREHGAASAVTRRRVFVPVIAGESA